MPHGGIRYQPTPAPFRICFSHGCDTVAPVSLTRMEWQQATSPLTIITGNPDEERHAIAESIARLEQIAGQHAGTPDDKEGNFTGFGQPGQMDCIDESTNSTTYLLMIEQANLLRWHKVSGMRTRFGFQAGFPHRTAIIVGKDTGVLYAVDSWFHDNGQRPEIINYQDWKSGWSPGDD